MRDNYNKIKKAQKTTTGQPASNKRNSWPLFELLRFLDAADQERSSLNTLPDTEDSTLDTDFTEQTTDGAEEGNNSPDDETNISENDERNFSSSDVSTPKIPSTISRKRKSDSAGKLLQHIQKRDEERKGLIQKLLTKNQEEDDVDSFMKSIAFTVKKFPPHLRAYAKTRILSLVTELEFTESTTSSVNSSPYNVTYTMQPSSNSLNPVPSTSLQGFNYPDE